MKAIVRPVCAGCGYRYDPRKKVGLLKEQGREDEIGALIKTFKAV